MGTRGRINVYDDVWGKDTSDRLLVSIYKQMDGYPSGLGIALAEFCAPFKIVNGFGDRTTKNIANGMGCFAAQLIGHLKTDVGSVYIVAPTSEAHGYTYEIRPSSPVNAKTQICLHMRVWDYDGSTVLYDGPASDAVEAMGKADE